MIRFALLWLFLTATALPGRASKWAILIEIGRYQHTEGRMPLSTDRDTYWVRNTLQQQAFTRLVLLENERARAKDIRRELDSLVVRCQPGDKVVIHYGGHGTQLDDDNGDEKDHLDEVLVPYDAPSRQMPNYAASPLFIRDDELAIYLGKLRQRVGAQGHVLVLIDACHSGTMSRGQARLRTDNVVPALVADTVRGKPVSGWFDPLPATVRTAGPQAAVVLMAGSQANQNHHEILDSDGKAVGPLAFFFSEAMTRIDQQTTYGRLADYMREAMRKRLELVDQQPTLEGDSQALLLGGDLVLPGLITRLKLAAGNRFRQVKGRLMGYGKGSEVAVRVARVRGDTASTTVTGHVVEATPFESVIELVEPMPTTDSVYLETSLLVEALPSGAVRVKLTDLAKHPQGGELAEWLRTTPGVELVTDGADWLIRPNGTTIALCRAADGELMEQVDADQIASLPGRLMAQVQANWFRRLDLHNAAMQATMVLTPVRFAPDSDSLLATLPTEWRNGLPVFRTDQQALFEIRNTGTLPFYFSLIDVLPDATIAVPLPNNKYPATSLRLLPGQTRSFPLVTISPPSGLETYKLLLTSTPVDIGALVQSRGARVDDGLVAHPLAKLLMAYFQNAPNQSLPLNEVGLSDCRFWVDKPKR